MIKQFHKHHNEMENDGRWHAAVDPSLLEHLQMLSGRFHSSLHSQSAFRLAKAPLPAILALGTLLASLSRLPDTHRATCV
jgi:hypothetical protein